MHDTLRVLPYFSDVSDDLLERVSVLSEVVDLDEGIVIIEEGTDSLEMYVVVSGELIVTKRSGGKDIELARVGPGEVIGEIALLDEAPRTATVTTHGPTKLIKIPATAFEDLLGDPHVVRRMFRTVTSRLRGIEDTLRHEERMAALGRMAAQLMHELNNPAAAVARSTKELTRLQADMAQEAKVLGAAFGGPELPEPTPHENSGGGLERSDAEDALATWLADAGVEDPWELAPALVSAGWTPDELESALAETSGEVRTSLAKWIGLGTLTGQILDELAIGASRISELVRVVKEYSFLDRAPVQEIDPTDGIRDTLILLKHKLRDIEVVLDFEDGLSPVVVPGRDLNQVWTNLIDNAADAMAGGGTLTITARNGADGVIIEISDTGGGIPEEVASRIWDPFFTTKEPGKGTGLGLHTVHTLVGRSGGTITMSTAPGGTKFTVTLPA